MDIERKAVTTGSAYIAYPQFTGNGCEKMNAFYLSLAEEAKKAADGLPAGVRYFADYKTDEADGKLTVRYFIRTRRLGRTEKTRTFEHIWESGLISSWSANG